MLYIVMRKPCFQEDEGRHFLEGTFKTREEAESYIEKNTKDGYYRKSDFSILEKT